MSLAMKVVLVGVERFKKNLQVAAAKVMKEAEANMERAAILVESNAQSRIRGSRTRSLFVPKGGKRVRRKKPRAITARPTETGIFENRLRNSASHRVTRSGHTIDAEVSFATVYAPKQEKKRSFLGAAITATANEVYTIIGRSFKVLE